MYRIYSDNLLIYDPNFEEYSLIDGSLSLEVNSAGTLTFTMPRDNPHYGMIKLMKSIVTLYDDDRLLFRGRPYAPSLNLYRSQKIECEGELAFLNDSFQEPFELYTGDVKTLFTSMIEKHNQQVGPEKQFKIGNITVTNTDNVSGEGNITRSSIEYMTTWEFLKDKFVGSALGGYVWIRHADGEQYIDYVPDLSYLNSQSVEQCINLIDADKEATSEGLATVILPLGAKLKDAEGMDTDEYTTIKSVNNGKPYIEDSGGIKEYGRIVQITHHDNVTDPLNLLRVGKADLGKALGITTTLTLSAADLSKAGYTIDPFRFGAYVDVKVKNLNIDQKMLIKKLQIDLLNPGSNNITVGSVARSFTVDQVNTSRKQGQLIKETEAGVRRSQRAADEAQNNLQEAIYDMTTLINESTEGTMTKVSETYYDKNNVDRKLAEQSTTFTQDYEKLEFIFNTFEETQNQYNENTEAQFSEITRYIRMKDGTLELGEESNPIVLRLINDRISFIESGQEVAYWQNRKFYAVDGEFINSLQLGKFAFIPRVTGNLSFKKVID